MGWLVAVKLSGAHVRHKSDSGALALGLETGADVEAESQRLLALPEAQGAKLPSGSSGRCAGRC